MKSGTTYLKVAAFIPAIVLVGAYIGQSAGAFQLFPQPAPTAEPQPEATPQAAAPHATSAVNAAVTTGAAPGAITQPDEVVNYSLGNPPPVGSAIYMGGSKYIVLTTANSIPLLGQEPAKSPVFMTGSKTFSVFNVQPAPTVPSAPNPFAPKP